MTVLFSHVMMSIQYLSAGIKASLQELLRDCSYTSTEPSRMSHYSYTMIVLTIVSVFALAGLSRTRDTPLTKANGIHFFKNETAVESAVSLSCAGVWSVPVQNNGSMGCKCGSDLDGLVHCDNSTLQVQLRLCYCMSQYIKDSNATVVGPCMYKCHHSFSFDKDKTQYNSVPGDISELSRNMCSIGIPGSFKTQSLNRDGQLCGKCKEGFAPPAYSYDWHCVRCLRNVTSWKTNWVKYFAMAYLPLTVCLIVIITFHINATSPSLNAFVLISQLTATPVVISFTSRMEPGSISQLYARKAVLSLYGVWNLDFFRSFYPLFCLHPNMGTLQVLALDYIIAAYPLILIVITYGIMELHDSGCKMVVWLWKPFRSCFLCFKRQWDIRASLIDAFVSFLLLSYVKFLNVSVNFLIPVHLYKVDGTPVNQSYLFFDATVKYFGKRHLPYAILAIAILSVFNIAPILMLCIYPRSWFQKFLNRCKFSCLSLHIFLDAFQGCYKNGTNGTSDARWFSAVYFMVRVFFFTIASIIPTIVLFALFAGILFLFPLVLIAVFQPYKSSFYNTIDAVLMLISALWYFLAVGCLNTLEIYRTFWKPMRLIFSIFGIAPLAYITVIVLCYLFSRNRLSQQWLIKLWRLLQCQRQVIRKSPSEESLPERLTNPEESAELFQEPIHYGATDGHASY